jgi:dipeptidase E
LKIDGESFRHSSKETQVTMHLVLASDLSGLLPKLGEAVGGRKGRMLHVPTAATGEGWVPDPLPDDALDGFDAVYIGGGNTFFLLHHMKRTGFFDLVRTAVANGMLYIGSSAGSVVTTPDIGYAEKIDNRTLGDGGDAGLGFVGFSILPHLDHESMGEAVRAQFDGWEGGPVFGLNDGQVIVINGQKIRVL